ncbi:unnamed protein product [Euphydryas editha]|uniref:Uncharacterized protein n=1 Tax=Euphydryas editha TaxID=104508 RepID=A0AAU9TH05_EUPED|nr:unnamed protein product [Euphydryas editha]
MKIIFLEAIFVIFVTAVFSAPVTEDGQKETRTLNAENSQVDHQRERRLDTSFYAVSPCAAASSSNIPVASYAPDAIYQSNFGPLQTRYFSSDYGHPDYTRSWYRTEEPHQDNREMLRYSDTNFVDTTQMGNIFRSAPSSYGSMNLAGGYNGQMANGYGTAYGIFPNANVGDCNVPLLFSCSPSIVTGQIVNPDSQGYFDSAVSGKPLYGYRGVNSHYLHGVPSHIEQQTNDHASVSSVANHVQNSKGL